jgi:DNA repair exonuclease SbcCD nuclease subunit
MTEVRKDHVKRIWIISDTHLGVRSNSTEWIEIIREYFFEFFIPLVKKEYKEGDILYHLGDVFDNRQSLNLLAQHLAIEIFEELSKIFPEIHVIVGNHDIYKKNSNDVSSVDCIKYIPKVQVYKEPVVHLIGKKSCLLMPWRKNKEHELETLSEYSVTDYVFCHSEVRGLQIGPNPTIKHDGGNSVEIYKNYTRVYSGHIHYRQKSKNFVLVGNPYHMTRSDRDNTKGIYLLDVESGKDTFYENTYSPKFLIFYIMDILEMSTEEFISKIKNNFVDLYIPSEVIANYNISMLMNLIEGNARKIEPHIYDDERLIDDIEVDELDIEVAYRSLSVLNLSDTFIESTDYDDQIKERMKKSIRELYNNSASKA